MDQGKLSFLKNEFVAQLKTIDANVNPLWGKMNAQQMVEHLVESFKEANGKTIKRINTPKEQIPKMKAFLLSDTPFKENTKNRELPEEPFPTKCKNISEAIAQLEIEVDDFFKIFENEPDTIIDNATFGDLDYEHWIALLYKHTKHHIKQFLVN